MPFQVSKSFISPSKRCAGLVIIPSVWVLASIMALPNAVYYQLYDENNVWQGNGIYKLFYLKTINI